MLIKHQNVYTRIFDLLKKYLGIVIFRLSLFEKRFFLENYGKLKIKP